MIATNICRDRNVEFAHSSMISQGRMLCTTLLSITLLSGCSFFEEPVYNRYGELIDTNQYSQTMYVAEQVFEQAEPVATVSKTTAAIPVAVAPVTRKLAPTIVAKTATASSGSYSIQLFAAYDKSFSQRYIQQHKLQAGAYVRELEHQGRPWFVVLYGQYATVHEAVRARKGLAASLTKSGAWIRSIAHKQHTVLPNYSLQLIASRSRVHTEKFIRQYNIGSKGYIQEIVHKGAPLYLVLYGEYQHDQKARQAIPTLTKELQALKPWVRALGHGVSTPRVGVRAPKHSKTAKLPTFTLQLMASISRENAEKLIRDNKIGSKGSIKKIIRSGTPLYLVLYGNYQFPQNARKAIPTLSKELQALKPWVRSAKR